jgi:hypothetical protein
MATPRKLNVLVCFPSYGGNGGIAAEHPDVRGWAMTTFQSILQDDRIESYSDVTENDTPITMVRNRFVEIGREQKADVLVMVDSDMRPDYYPDAPKFWDTSFSFLHEHWEKGPVVIGAPYCGPPPRPPHDIWGENPYVFKWQSTSNSDLVSANLEQYSRDEAANATGITNVAALPTGLIMYDMRVFDIIEKPYFYYEYPDDGENGKMSTEDVTNTRDISMAGEEILGYNPLYCNWDAWAGHWKPWCVGKPTVWNSSNVCKKNHDAVLRGPAHKTIEMSGAIPFDSEQGRRLMGVEG